MITEQHTQEQLSRAYITAVAGIAGVNLAYRREHDYGIDGTFRSVTVVDGKRQEDGFALDFQLRSTVNAVDQYGRIAYDVDAKTYNQLAIQDGMQGALTCILLVLCLPTNRADWLSVAEDALTLRRACYWFRPSGQLTTNARTTRIQIPKAQLFTPSVLQDIMRDIEQGSKP